MVTMMMMVMQGEGGFIDTNGSSDSAFAPLIILARIGSNYIKPFHQRTHKVTQTFMVLSICSDFDNMLFSQGGYSQLNQSYPKAAFILELILKR